MLQIKRLTTEGAEENLTELIIEQVRKNNMTILNFKEVTAKVVDYLEANAVLEPENIQMESKFRIGDETLKDLPEVKVTENGEIAPAAIKSIENTKGN